MARPPKRKLEDLQKKSRLARPPKTKLEELLNKKSRLARPPKRELRKKSRLARPPKRKLQESQKTGEAVQDQVGEAPIGKNVQELNYVLVFVAVVAMFMCCLLCAIMFCARLLRVVHITAQFCLSVFVSVFPIVYPETMCTK